MSKQSVQPLKGTPDELYFVLSTVASARAIAKNTSIVIESNPTAISLGLTPPAQSPFAGKDSRARGFSDSIALLSTHHNHHLHLQLRPAGSAQRFLFNEMERARCEALGAQKLAGCAHNLASLWQHQKQQGKDGNSGNSLLLELVALTRNILGAGFNEPRAETTSDAAQYIVEQHQALWQSLHNAITSQHEYAAITLRLIDALESNDNLPSTLAAPDNEQPAPQDQKSTASEEESEPETDTELTVNLRDEDDQNTAEANVLPVNDSDTTDASANRDAPVSTESDTGTAYANYVATGYCVYSTAEDEVILASNLCSNDELTLLRQQLDEHIQRHARVIGKLSGRLQRVLMAQQTRHWEFNLPEGTLDTTRLTRVATQPLTPLSFKQESDTDFKDTCVSVLVDNSKSMLGKPITIAAACAEILSQTLERCGVSSEILGFTTTNLHQGELFHRWQQESNHTNPGRLNGLRHIIYKAADTPHRRSRANFSVMLKKDILKQNIDGESLLWAYSRLLKRPEKRKVLIVISDGEPIDTSTMSANTKDYLSDHLHSVINAIESRTEVDLLAIGIGHDVTKYYQRSMKIMQVKDLSQSLLAQLTDLFKTTH